jgi:hypothetical protein
MEPEGVKTKKLLAGRLFFWRSFKVLVFLPRVRPAGGLGAAGGERQERKYALQM